MAVPVIESVTGFTGGSASSYNVTKPSGLADNDLVLIVIGKPYQMVLTAPAGFTFVGPTNTSFSGLGYMYKYVTDASSEPSSYTITSSIAGFWAGGIYRISGVDYTTPISGHQSAGSDTSSGTITILGSTSAATDSLLISLASTEAVRTFTPPSGMTEAFDNQSGPTNGYGISVTSAYLARPGSAGVSSGNKTFTISSSIGSRVGTQFSVNGGSPPDPPEDAEVLGSQLNAQVLADEDSDVLLSQLTTQVLWGIPGDVRASQISLQLLGRKLGRRILGVTY